jgi:MoaA/NifB/PqqE/SkfB family radical SAM enzyme
MQEKLSDNQYVIDSLLKSISFEEGWINHNVVRRINSNNLSIKVIGSFNSVITGHANKEVILSNKDGVFEVIENDTLLGYVIYFCQEKNNLISFYFNANIELLLIKKIVQCKLQINPLVVNPVDWIEGTITNVNKTSEDELDKAWNSRLYFKNITVNYYNELEKKVRLQLSNTNNCKNKMQLLTLLVQNVPTLVRLQEAQSLYLSINDIKLKKSLLPVYSAICRMLDQKSIIQNKIIRINWGIYNRCPLTCIGCYNIFNDGIMSLNQCISIADKLIKYKIKELIISGGDPLLWPDIVEFCQYLSNKGILVGIDTVSYNLNQELCSKLVNNIAYVGIPLDGPNQKIIEFFRRGKQDLFQVILNSLNIASKIGVPIRLNTTVHKRNIDSLDDIAKIILNYSSIKVWSIYQWWPLRGNELITEKMLVSSIEFEQKVSLLKKTFPNLNIVSRRINERERSAFFISSNGEVYTFSEEEQISPIILGDIKNQSLEKILESPALKKDSNKFKFNSRFYNNMLLEHIY